jgi:predicted anti-sigma-YlaC factor YlaD
MSRCLGDKALLLLYDGEGTSAERTHLAECEACVARYREMGCDLEAISHVLREEPPPKTVSQFSPSFTIRALPRAAALALALVLMWIGVRLWSPSGRAPLNGTNGSEVWSLLDELRSNPFLLTDALAVELATEGAASYEVAAAVLEAERPCEWYDLRGTGYPESPIDEPEILAGLRFCVGD